MGQRRGVAPGAGNGSALNKGGYAKIVKTCDVAKSHGLAYAWIGTCCTDKTSSAQLSEAINSIYRWYQESAICYAFLVDVADDSEIRWSEWFIRGGPCKNSWPPRLCSSSAVIGANRNQAEHVICDHGHHQDLMISAAC